MNLSLFKIIAAIIILVLTIVTGLWPFLKKRNAEHHHGHSHGLDFPTSEAFATGVFLGAGLLHMLPDASKAFDNAGYSQYPFAFLIASSSFLLLLLIEHINSSIKRQSSGDTPTSIALLTAVILSIHSLFEGTAVGTAGLVTGLVITIAIIAHKGAASFALSVQLNKSPAPMPYKILSFSIFAIMTPLGIFLGSHLPPSHLLTPIFNSLAAGTFLYIGTLHGLERASLIKDCCNLREFSVMLSGFLVMALVAIWV